MKIKHCVWLSTFLVALCTFALPAAAQASHGCCRPAALYSSGYKFANYDGCCPRYYKYKYKYVRCYQNNCGQCTCVRVVCKVKPAHWVGCHFFPAKKVCWLKRI